MLLHRCSVCGREYLPAGIHALWHKVIGRIPHHILDWFCHCKPPAVARSEKFMTIDYGDLIWAINEVGKQLKRNQ